MAPFTAHQHIRILRLSFLSSSSLSALLVSFNLPALDVLEVKVQQKSTHTTTGILTQFLRRSQCQLTQLYSNITLESDFEQDLVNFLTTLPTLQQLHITDPFSTTTGLGKAFFGALHPTSHDDTAISFLPSLEVLSYEGQLSVGYLEFMVKSMLSRTKKVLMTPVVLMKTFRIRCNLYDDPSDYFSAICELLLGSMADSSLPWMNDEILGDILERIESKRFEFMDRKGNPWVISDNKEGYEPT